MLVGFAILMTLVLGGSKLLYNYFNRKINGVEVTCKRALTGSCPGQNIPDHELRALILLRVGMKTAAALKGHTLFGQIRQYRSTTVPSLNIHDAGRKLISMDLISNKLTAIATNFDRWLEKNAMQIEENRMTGSYLTGEMMGLISNTVEDYEKTYRQLGIPEEAISAFRRYHEPAIEKLVEDINATSHSDWVHTSVEKVGMVLSFVEGLLDRMIIDAEQAMAALNGELTGKMYKGVKCGPVKKREDFDPLATWPGLSDSGAKQIKDIVAAAEKYKKR
jgi:hypothetical protein